MKSHAVQKRKATFVLEDTLLAELKQAVKTTGAKSVNALVKTAISRLLKDVRNARRKDILRDAANDPMFRQDVYDVERDFIHADGDLTKDG